MTLLVNFVKTCFPDRRDELAGRYSVYFSRANVSLSAGHCFSASGARIPQPTKFAVPGCLCPPPPPLPRFQFWNGCEIPRGVFYLFLGPRIARRKAPCARASRSQHPLSRTKSRIFNRFSLHLASLSLPLSASLVEISSLPELYVADVKEKYERLKSPR